MTRTEADGIFATAAAKLEGCVALADPGACT
jgi:hypothetical protein